jgi:hypothetical protein
MTNPLEEFARDVGVTLTAKESIEGVLEGLGLTMEVKFVPFSQSRNKAEKHKSLNWIVTIKRNGRELIATDYSAGIAHCPSYNRKCPANAPCNQKSWQEFVCAWECENGFRANPSLVDRSNFWPNRNSPVLPDFADVMHSLVMDSDVLNNSGFEDWASNFGFETDSRKAESMYRACLEIALKLKAGLGNDGLQTLAEAFQEY